MVVEKKKYKNGKIEIKRIFFWPGFLLLTISCLLFLFSPFKYYITLLVMVIGLILFLMSFSNSEYNEIDAEKYIIRFNKKD